jgi:N-methylhydantoinase B
MSAFDAVSLGIMWDRLIAITDEIVSSLVRTSFSLVVRDGGDLSCVLFDRAGNALAQGTYSVPSFTGTAGPTLRQMLERFPPETLVPGDVLMTNDPWIGTGHLYDINVMRPVFRRGALVGYTLSITHLPDIGGAGFSSTSTQIFEEGLRLPVSKIVRAGRQNDELLELIRTNVRVPEQVIGDLMANVTCNEVGGRLLVEFMDEYGLDDLDALSHAIRAQSEAAMRERIEAIPDGSYAHRIAIEGIAEPIALACTVTVAGGGIAIDFAGTGPTVPAAINVPICYTRAWSAYCVKCLTIPSIPNNEGSVAPLTVTAPENCILNAWPPCATGGRHSVGHFVVPLVFGALAEALPDEVQADVAMLNIFNVRGTHRKGQDFSSLFLLAGGFGALKGMDGAPTTPAPSNMGVIATEAWEAYSSMTIARRALWIDSGGPGTFRGGVGQEAELVNDTGHPLHLALLGQRTRFPAAGLLGGRPGALRSYRINGAPVDPKARHVLQPGDRLTTLEAGGGGYGDPRERSVERVVQDVRSGFVSVEGALRDYGVAVDPIAWSGRRR